MDDKHASSVAEVERVPGRPVLRIGGDWITPHLVSLEDRLAEVEWPEDPRVRIDATGLRRLDTSGAYVLIRLVTDLEADGREVWVDGLSEASDDLIHLVRHRLEGAEAVEEPRGPMFLEQLGRLVGRFAREGLDLLAFTGEAFLAFVRMVREPVRIRWRTALKNVETAGLNALPIVGLLTFLLGIVIAYQGGVQLKNYGANIFIVELVTITFFRELAPLITAIIVAGRTGSAYTAEIGTMKVTEEVDALTTLGIGPMDVLVIPKVLGLVIALPLLTVFADGMGVLGGMVMANAILDVDYVDFINRIPDTVSVTHFAIGVGKAPAFAAIVATVGCFQGFQVRGGAEAVGQHTTTSVVQSIFLVIVADAMFSILFSWMGI